MTLSQVKFGAATSSNDLNMGILGVSFGEEFNLDYPNFVDALAQQGVTKTRAFGVALGAKTEATAAGLISFGGVDTKKYAGKLHTSAILAPQAGERLYRYWVRLSSIGLRGKAYPNTALAVFFDTGATLSYLPDSLVRSIVNDLGGQRDAASGLFKVPCGQTGTMDFTFGDMTINVQLSEFIWDLGSSGCYLGADSASDSSLILGDSFLRSVYAVFDIDSGAIHFAPYVNCGTNLQAIPTGTNAAANFTGECTAGAKNAASGISITAAGKWLAAAAAVAIMAL